MLLSAQVIGTAGAALMLWSRPIEQAKELVATIRVHHLDELPVVVTAYTAGPAISGYLQRPVYYPNIGGPGSWVEWRRASDPVREQDVSELVGRYDLDRYLLVTAPLGSGPEQRVNVEAIASFMEGQREHARVKLFLVTPSVTPNMAPTDLTGQP